MVKKSLSEEMMFEQNEVSELRPVNIEGKNVAGRQEWCMQRP